MADPFVSYEANLTSPAERHFAITPSDSVDMAIRPRAIRVGGGGDISVVDIDGTAITYAVTAGEVVVFRGVRVNLTGTTATNLVGWY